MNINVIAYMYAVLQCDQYIIKLILKHFSYNYSSLINYITYFNICKSASYISII